MGKRGTWFSAIKNLFTSNNNKLNSNEGKEKKGVRGRLKHGSFLPRFREPSSIEKILGEVDQQLYVPPTQTQTQSQSESQHNNNLCIPPTQSQTLSQPQPSSSSPPTITSPTLVVHHPQTQITEQQHLSATRIQAAYRGYMARKKTNSKPFTTGLVRLQGVIRGQQVKRQTVNAMKQMQLLVRLQTQIHSRRIQIQPLKHQPNNNKQQLLSDDEYWDDSLITKEEREARLHRKAEALINRQKAMTYAYSHQLWKATPKNSIMDIRSPWWWSRLERHFPSHVNNHQSPSRATPDLTKKKQSNSSASVSPMSSRSMVPPRTRQRTKYPIKDDDSLMSCPAFSVPNYMSPTLSAKAKARPTSNPKDRMPTTPGSERRLSFPPTPSSSASFNWKKGSRKHKSPGSIGDLSTDSAISMVGRKAFNRFV